MKKIIALLLVIALTAGISIAGTTAYLQSEDSDINVMTLGNVKIEQIEQERNAAGNLVNFTQAKPAYPAVGEIAWADKGVDVNGTEYKVFTPGLQNVVDKIVTVKNTGISSAYVRTFVAIEAPGYDPNDLIHFNYNNTGVSISAPVEAKIDGTDYVIFTFTYPEALDPGDISVPSLMQVFLDSKATNEDVAMFGDTWEILVASQAVQTQGFADAATALNTAFGTGHPWVDGVVIPDHFVSTLEELEAAFAEGGNIQLTNDIKFEKITAIEPGKEVYLDLNGKTITVDQGTSSNTLFYVKDGAKLTIDGNGTIDLDSVSTMAIFAPYGELVIENGTFIRDKVETVTNKTTGLFMGAKTTSSKVTINGGYFDSGYYDENAAAIEGILAGTVEFTETADDIAKRGNSKDANLVRTAIKDNVSALLNHAGYGSFKVYGGTFVGANPAWGDEGCMMPTTPNYLRPWSYYQGALLVGQVYNENGIVLPDGYTITSTVNGDGVPVYTVNYSK